MLAAGGGRSILLGMILKLINLVECKPHHNTQKESDMKSRAAVERVIEEATFSINNGGSYSYMKESIASMAASGWGRSRAYRNMLEVLEAVEAGEMLPILGGNFAAGLGAIMMHEQKMDMPPNVSVWMRR